MQLAPLKPLRGAACRTELTLELTPVRRRECEPSFVKDPRPGLMAGIGFGKTDQGKLELLTSHISGVPGKARIRQDTV